jgi:hypothetical protein
VQHAHRGRGCAGALPVEQQLHSQLATDWLHDHGV